MAVFVFMTCSQAGAQNVFDLQQSVPEANFTCIFHEDSDTAFLALDLDDSLFLQTSDGQPPLNCSVIQVIAVTATDPVDLPGGARDSIPANSVGIALKNDEVPSVANLLYITEIALVVKLERKRKRKQKGFFFYSKRNLPIEVEPYTGGVVYKAQYYTGLAPQDNGLTFSLVATSGAVRQQYSVQCTDFFGALSNPVTFWVGLIEKSGMVSCTRTLIALVISVGLFGMLKGPVGSE
ncbi:hypothetical protein BV898_19733 [Hypsibius exemplaris]|uniref:Uncharacterized protein n=1 Tax=Hypsibius exemplaris TaxID=2072580 RepID=A0A9X6NLF3_HYPEX|nr:hypothetical protein BV898_19733 [Hypsibius exemplaris]